MVHRLLSLSRLIILFISFCGLFIYLKRKNIDPYWIPGLIFCGTACGIFIAGMLNSLAPGSILIELCGIFLFLLMIKEKKELVEQEESLDADISRLSDDEYIARYAREKYFYSKDGELILRIED